MTCPAADDVNEAVEESLEWERERAELYDDDYGYSTNSQLRIVLDDKANRGSFPNLGQYDDIGILPLFSNPEENHESEKRFLPAHLHKFRPPY